MIGGRDRDANLQLFRRIGAAGRAIAGRRIRLLTAAEQDKRQEEAEQGLD
jgi:hypothetical protein